VAYFQIIAARAVTADDRAVIPFLNFPLGSPIIPQKSQIKSLFPDPKVLHGGIRQPIGQRA
jgi:hypothetical protein